MLILLTVPTKNQKPCLSWMERMPQYMSDLFSTSARIIKETYCIMLHPLHSVQAQFHGEIHTIFGKVHGLRIYNDFYYTVIHFHTFTFLKRVLRRHNPDLLDIRIHALNIVRMSAAIPS